MPSELAAAPADSISVPFAEVAGFTRKLIHDVRNGLNALDLQLASMLEAPGGIDEPVREDLLLARRLLNNEARRLVSVSALFRPPAPQIIEYLAADLIEDMKARIERTFGAEAPPMGWNVAVADERVAVDFEMLSAVLIELVRNARQFREGTEPLRARIGREKNGVVLELRESRTEVTSDPATWGVAPFHSTRRGAYGLGLFAARQAVAALGGSLVIRHDAEQRELCSRVMLPLAQ